MGQGSTAGTVSEDDVEFRGDPLAELARTVNTQSTPKGQEGEAKRENLEALLSILPVVGNVISGRDMFDSAGATSEALLAGDKKGAAINAGLTGLNAAGAVLGLPFGKAAKQAAKAGKDSVNVFVPATDDSLADLAREMREGGSRNLEVHKETGKFFGPEGVLKEEIPDYKAKMKITPEPHTSTKVRDTIEHPELFEQFPELGDLRIDWKAPSANRMQNAARTKDNIGGLEIVSNTPKPISDISKLLQYVISAREGFSPAFRHGEANIRSDLLGTLDRANKSGLTSPKDLEALTAYSERVKRDLGLLDDVTDQYRQNKVVGRNAGNVEAKQVLERATMEGTDKFFPYATGKRVPYKAQQASARTAGYQQILPLIPQNATQAQAQNLVRDWYTLGSGREPALELDALMKRLKEGT